MYNKLVSQRKKLIACALWALSGIGGSPLALNRADGDTNVASSQRSTIIACAQIH